MTAAAAGSTSATAPAGDNLTKSATSAYHKVPANWN
jgi:hypothetical protein